MILGVIKGALLFANLFPIPILLVIFAALKKIPIKPWQKLMAFCLYDVLTPLWTNINTCIISFGSKTKWQINSHGSLKPKGWYFLMSNHRSWADIMVLQKVFNRKIPMLKFFMKKELLWTLPIGGIACWLMDFPIMQRHSKEYLKKHPGQRNKDIETTKRSCEKFKHEPVTIINFCEGTRFTEEKNKKRSAPYKNLLSAKSGGIAFTLATMEGLLHEIIDVTIVYSPKESSLWDILCNKTDFITVDYEVIKIPQELRGDYYKDKEFKRNFQQWLNQRWAKKDKLIAKILDENTNAN